MDTLLSLDTSLFLFVYGLAGSPVFVPLIQAVGEWSLYLILFILFAAFLYASLNRHSHLARALFLAVSAGLVARFGVTEPVQRLIERERPFLALDLPAYINQTDFSFPSGHATFFFALATGLYAYNRRLGIAFFIIAILVSLARIMAGVHYPLDIAGGACVGVLVALVIIRLLGKRSGATRGGPAR